MQDLRKKVLLESKKTISRKARSRPESTRSSFTQSPVGSPAHSQAGSQPSSRPTSRYASEEEGTSDSENEDNVMVNTGSASEEDADELLHGWAERLQDRASEILDRKHSSVQGREDALKAYTHLARHHYARRQIEHKVSDLTSALLRSIRSGSSGERSSAIKALTVTILTCPSNMVFDRVFSALTLVCEETEEEGLKVEAIHALSISLVYGGGSVSATEDMLLFLLGIIESDGQSVGADDSGPVVTAALQAWALVASHSPNVSDHIQSEQFMEAFMEQLDSTDPRVQMGAGTNIALLFESARDDSADRDLAGLDEEGKQVTDEKPESQPRYSQYEKHKVTVRISEIIRDSSKRNSKKERRELRNHFSSIMTSVERDKGPDYSTAGGLTGTEYGYRGKIRVRNRVLIIDTWHLWTKVEVLRNQLGGGLGVHVMENPLVQVIVASADARAYSPGCWKAETKDKMRRKELKGGRPSKVFV